LSRAVSKSIIESSEEEPESTEKPPSYLQLFRYNLESNTETMIKDFTIKEEKYFLNPVFNKNFSSKFIVYSD
jgi:hypothetical protein